jgi:hypothetical protein
MHDVDFLPAEYRQRRRRRRDKPWQVIVVIAFSALLAAAAVAQQQERRRLRRELDAVEPAYQSALEQQRRLAELQGRMQRVGAAAELFTYLRHPWPRTQVLEAILEPLPEEVRFEKIRIVAEAADQRPAGPAAASRAQRRAAEDELARLDPAQRDLRLLRDEHDALRTVVRLSGTATDGEALHHYLDRLGNNPVFRRADLETIENLVGAHQGEMRFEATLVVRPGYGQPGGPEPEGDPSRAIAQTPRPGGSNRE